MNVRVRSIGKSLVRISAALAVVAGCFWL